MIASNENLAVPGIVVRSRQFNIDLTHDLFEDQTMQRKTGDLMPEELCTVLAVHGNALYVLTSTSRLGWAHCSDFTMDDGSPVFESTVMFDGWVDDERPCEECGKHMSVGNVKYQCDACMICMCISCMDFNTCISSAPNVNETHRTFGTFGSDKHA